jgi:hypothetical protein
VPAALPLFFLITRRDNLRLAIGLIMTFAAGFLLVIASELTFYAVLTGDPLHRLVIDRGALAIPSKHLKGGVFLEGSPLFNWKLARLWSVPESFDVHWTINPVLNLLFSQQILFAPWLALGGFALAWNARGPLRDLGIIAALIVALQYLIFTYAIVLPPNIRYYGASVFMLCVMAGIFVASQTRLVRIALIGCVMAGGIAMATVQRSYPYFSASVGKFASQSGTLYALSLTADRLYWAARSDPVVAKHLQIAEAPKGEVAVLAYEDTPALNQRCSDGGQMWRTLEVRARPSMYWRLAEWLRISRLLPDRLAAFLRRDQEMAAFARRQC